MRGKKLLIDLEWSYTNIVILNIKVKFRPDIIHNIYNIIEKGDHLI